MGIIYFKTKEPKNKQQYFPSDYIPKENRKLFRKNENPEIAKMRSSNQWQDICDYIKNKEPICWICEISRTEEIHHIIEVSKDFKLFFEITNLAPLCKECHKQVHASYRRGIDPIILFQLNKRLTYNINFSL